MSTRRRSASQTRHTAGTSGPLRPARGFAFAIPGLGPLLAEELQAIEGVQAQGTVADYANTGDRAFLGHDDRTSYGLVFVRYPGQHSPPSLASQITSAIRPLLPRGSQVSVTGMNELINATQSRAGLGVLAETLIAGSAALAILLFVFGSALAWCPS